MSRVELARGDRVVVKVGTSSIVDSAGRPDDLRMSMICDGIAETVASGIDVIFVSSGAIAAGLEPLGFERRPPDIPSLQAAAAVGQGRLLRRYSRALEDRGLTSAQILLTRHDFMHRQQYLNARNTLERLLALKAVPIVNENDTVAVDEIRFGDNDRLAALVANLVRAKLLVLLTDTEGLHAGDPRRDPGALLIDEVERITPELEAQAGGRGSDLASGGMASKLAAAWVATFSGVSVVVGSAGHPDAIQKVVAGVPVGTYFHPRPHRASARRLWIAFGTPPKGTVVVDQGARRAIVVDKRSLLPAGVVAVRGGFTAGDTVDVEEGGTVFARGQVRYSDRELGAAKGKSSKESAAGEVIHRDQLVILE